MSETIYRAFVPELEVRAAAQGGDGRTVQGIAVPYDRPQRIHEDLVESFARGAFTHQMNAMFRVPYTREHPFHGGKPIGRIHEARDDAKGLWVAMRVSATPEGDETLTLIEDGVLSELSVGFRLLKPSWSRTLPDGTVQRVRAQLTEVASVLAGAYGQAAKVLAVRAADEDGPPTSVAESQAAPPLDEDRAARVRTARAKALVAAMPMIPAAARTLV
jgi:HK97 family phage prohead protease